jgi:hypothetical protein
LDILLTAVAFLLGTTSIARSQALLIAREPSQAAVLPVPTTELPTSLTVPISGLGAVTPTAAACVDADTCVVATDRPGGSFYELHVVRLSNASVVRSVDARGKVQFGVPAIAVNAAQTVAIATDFSIARRQVVVFPLTNLVPGAIATVALSAQPSTGPHGVVFSGERAFVCTFASTPVGNPGIAVLDPPYTSIRSARSAPSS